MLKIKTNFQNKTASFLTNPTISFHEFNSKTLQHLNLEETKPGQPFIYQYKDEDEDLIKITCEMELKEAFRFANKNSSDTLELVLLEPSQLKEKVASQDPFKPEIVQPNYNPPSSSTLPRVNDEKKGGPFVPFSSMMSSRPNLEATVPQMFQTLFDQGAIQVSPELMTSFKQLLSSIPAEPLEQFTRSALSNSTISQSLVSSSLANSSSKEPVIHPAICDNCKKQIVGIRYRCIYCEDFDLCQVCESKEGIHDENHMFVKITKKNKVPNVQKSTIVSSPKLSKEEEKKLSARLVGDSEVSSVIAGTKFIKTWTLLNSGTVSWPKGTTIVAIEGDKSLLPENTLVPVTQPTEQIQVPVEIVAPKEPGRYAVYLRLSSPSGQHFGHQLLLDFQVVMPDKYQEALQKLEEMGFNEREKNRILLEKHNGNVLSVVQELINS